MEYEEFKLYVSNPQNYDKEDIRSLKSMDEKELIEFENILNDDIYSLSEWDHFRNIISKNKIIYELKQELVELKK